MGKKTTYILIAIFILLAGGLFIRQKVQNINAKKALEERRVVIFNDAAEVSKIEAEKMGETTTLSKQNGVWRVGQYSAIPSQANGIVQGAVDARIFSVVIDGAASKQSLGIADEDFTIFRFFNNDEKIGEFKATYKEGVVYVQKENDSKISIVPSLGTYEFTNAWVSLHVGSFSKDAISSVSVTRGESHFELFLDGEEWKIGSRVANSEKVDDYLNALSYISAKELMREEESPPQVFSTIIGITSGENSVVYELEEKNAKDGLYYIKNSEGEVFIIDSETASGIVKQESDLL